MYLSNIKVCAVFCTKNPLVKKIPASTWAAEPVAVEATAQVIEVLTPPIEIVAVIFSLSANLVVVLLEPEFVYLTN